MSISSPNDELNPIGKTWECKNLCGCVKFGKVAFLMIYSGNMSYRHGIQELSYVHQES
jgi:hypothetical protein